MRKLNFSLPGISPVGLELIALLNVPDTPVSRIAGTAQNDAVIFGNIVACANSPAYKGVQTTTDILASLVRLGQREIKRIVYQVVLRSAFYHDSPEINAVLRRIWLQSLTASLFMQKLVEVAPGAYVLDAEEVDYLGCLGLLHNIGYVVLMVNFQDRFLEFFTTHAALPLDEFFAEERLWFDEVDHFSAGRAVLKHWNFPQAIWELVARYPFPVHDYRGEHPRLHHLLRLARHMLAMTDYCFHPTHPADYWLNATELPAVTVDYATLFRDVRDTALHIESSLS